jgi:hypothetical protein
VIGRYQMPGVGFSVRWAAGALPFAGRTPVNVPWVSPGRHPRDIHPAARSVPPPKSLLEPVNNPLCVSSGFSRFLYVTYRTMSRARCAYSNPLSPDTAGHRTARE